MQSKLESEFKLNQNTLKKTAEYIEKDLKRKLARQLKFIDAR